MNAARPLLTVRQALAFVAEHGAVLASAKGPLPRLTEAILGEPITGNWWSHPKAKGIYRILVTVQASDDVLVCRLVNDRITLVHRRLWPALARLGPMLAPRRTARVVERHTPNGRHVTHEIPFSQWVRPDVLAEADHLGEAEAVELLGRCALDTSPDRTSGKIRSA